jgi:hypothetical protein
MGYHTDIEFQWEGSARVQLRNDCSTCFGSQSLGSFLLTEGEDSHAASEYQLSMEYSFSSLLCRFAQQWIDAYPDAKAYGEHYC